MKLKIKESIEKINDIIVFDYVGDLVNVLLNKPQPYRICWDRKNDVYGLGNAYKYIHGFIEDGMKQLGYVPGRTEPMKNKVGMDIPERDDYEELTFVSYNVKDDRWQVGGFVGERSKPLYIPSGFLLYSSDDNPETCVPDLYKVLRRRNLIQDTLSESQLKKIIQTAKIRLQKAEEELEEVVDIMEENGFKLIDRDHLGADFKSYSDYFRQHPNGWGPNGISFRDLFVDTISGRNEDPLDVYVGEGDDSTAVHWMRLNANCTQKAVYKELMNLCKDYHIPYETFYGL